MSCLEELNLYLRIWNRPTFIDGNHLHNEILIHMLQLHTFNFYINTENNINGSTLRLSNGDIQRTFTNLGNQRVACIIDYLTTDKVICHVFSLPFKFDRLENITNNFPNIIFSHVTHLGLSDTVPFKYELFIRVTQSFPLLKYLSVHNVRPPYWEFHKPRPVDDWCSIVKYPHLISLDIWSADNHYVEHFLNETKTYLPCLIELRIRYHSLKTVTQNFTRDITRRNCANVKQLIVKDSIVYPKDVYRYFPSLSNEFSSDIF